MTPPHDPGQILICDEGTDPEGEKIVICDEAGPPEYEKIVICDEKRGEEEEEAGPDPCDGIGLPSIGSPAAGSVVTGDPTSGTIITVGGGLAPYSVSYSAGTVAQISTGQWRITALDSCGSSGSPNWGTITLTDVCGGQATRDVRNTGGIWCCLQPQGDPCPPNIRYDCDADWTGDGTGGTTCKNSQGYNCIINGYEYIIGGFKYIENLNCYKDRACDGVPLNGSNPCIAACVTDPCNSPCVVARWIAEWRCP